MASWFGWVSALLQGTAPCQGTAPARGRGCVFSEPCILGVLNLKSHRVGTSLSAWNRLTNCFLPAWPMYVCLMRVPVELSLRHAFTVTCSKAVRGSEFSLQTSWAGTVIHQQDPQSASPNWLGNSHDAPGPADLREECLELDFNSVRNLRGQTSFNAVIQMAL